MGKNYKQSNKDAVETVTTGSGKLFWMDQIQAGLEHYPSKATPTIPKLGQKIYDETVAGMDNVSMTTEAVPAVLKLEYVPFIGTTSVNNDPSNLDGVFANILATLRQKCTTAYNYDQGTVAAAILSVGMIPVLMAHVKRRMKSLFTRNLGANLSIDDIWIPFSDNFQGNKVMALQDMDGKISVYNDIVTVYNSLGMPNFFPILRRWEEMESEVFTDLENDPNGCGQLMYFSTTGYYFPEQNTDPANPGYTLKWKTFYGDLNTELNWIYSLAKTVQGDQDIMQVIGDVRKTYGGDPYKIPELKEDDLKAGLIPKYSYEVLMGIYHATVLPVQISDITIDARTGRLTSTYPFKSDLTTSQLAALRRWLRMPKLYNSQKFDEDLETCLSATQWMISDENYALNGNSISNVGTEIICNMQMWAYKFETGAAVLTPYERSNNVYWVVGNSPYNGSTSSNMTYGTISFRGKLKSFAYSPMFPVVYMEASDSALAQITNAKIVDPDVEMEYPCFIPANTLKQWHDAQRFRLWGLPHLVQFEADGQAKPYWN